MMKPNILLIEVDQWNARLLSCLGDPNVHTPHLDRLAARGTLFLDATCQNPACMPSRASMLSGQYLSTNHQFGFAGLCDRRTPWLPQTLKRAGYRTGAWGKFHTLCMGAHDENDGWAFDVAAPTLGEDEDMARPRGNTYRAYCEQNGVPWPTDQMHGHNPFGPPNPRPSSAPQGMPEMQRQSCQSDVPLEHSLETYTTDRCLDFLRECAQNEQPFFGWLTYDRPHHPSTLPPEWFARIRPDELDLPRLPTPDEVATWPRSLFHQAARGTSQWNYGEEAFRFVVATYFTLIEWLDSEIGRVLDELERLNLGQNTIVVFTSDHGDDAGWAGLYGKSAQASSMAIVGVPLLICAPDGVAGQTRSEPVELVDLFPTLCALAGVEAPESVEGTDLSTTVLRGEALDASRGVICEQWFKRSFQKDGWRLVFDFNEAEEQLYDLENDALQYRNLASSPEHLERKIELKRHLLHFLCARHFGPFTEADVSRIQRGLDPDDATLSLSGGFGADFPLIPFRAAAFVGEGDGRLLVPFWDEPMMLLAKSGYPTRRNSLPFDAARANALLDLGLRFLMRRTSAISQLTLGLYEAPAPSREEVEALFERLPDAAQAGRNR